MSSVLYLLDFIVGLSDPSSTLQTCPNETRWPYHMKSTTFFCLIPTIESTSLSPKIQKNKHISVIL